MAERGTRLPDDWLPSAEDRAYASARGLSQSEIDRIAEDYRDYWTCKAGSAALHRLWPRVWMRWVRTEADRRGRHPVSVEGVVGLVKVSNSDPRWPLLKARWQKQNGRPLNVSEWHFPQDWTERQEQAA